VRATQPLPFRGRVVWLTSAQGGRRSGPPDTPADSDYAATAFVPPESVETGLASFILRVDDRTAWQSTARGDWLIVANERPHLAEPGSVIVITEGPQPVAYFHVDRIDHDD